ncbi:MAG: hypothetical protein JSS66_02020 [Armatimonadetes bacterium]|nr:hypothetical protein [Armatimonadota bacterium]
MKPKYWAKYAHSGKAMQGLWNEPLNQEKKAELVEKVAQAVHKRRMETPAILFLEMHKPLAGLASQSLVVFSPFLIPFVGIGNVDDYSQLAGDRQSVEDLIKRLEFLREEPKGGSDNLDAMA